MIGKSGHELPSKYAERVMENIMDVAKEPFLEVCELAAGNGDRLV